MNHTAFTRARAALLVCLTLIFGSAAFAQKAAVRADRSMNPSSLIDRDRGSTASSPVITNDSPNAAWTPNAVYPIIIARYAFADDGENFYVISGVSGDDRTTAVNRYNTATNAWTPLAPIPEGTNAPSAALFNGKIYVAEGSGGTAPSNNLRIYDIATNAWSVGADIPGTPDRFGSAAGAFGGKVYVVGYGVPGGAASTDTQVYDIATNTWTAGAPAPTAFSLGGYTQVGQFLYCVGGYTGGAANSTATMRLDMATGTWAAGPTFTSGRADFALASNGGKLYAIGGDANGGGLFNATALVEELNISAFPAGAWVASPDNLPSARQANSAGFNSADGKIWSTGGVINSGFTFINQHLSLQEAVPFVVNTNLDNEANGCGTGLCTLREAITAANTNAQADLILFDPAFFNQARTITLVGSQIQFDPDASNLTSVSNTTGFPIIITGNNAVRVFNVVALANVALNALNITGGNGNNAAGAGIFNAGVLTITNSAIYGNTAATTANGGGIINNGSAATILTVINSTISGNSGANGGGIRNTSNGTVNLTAVTIAGNTAAGGATGDGGGISTASGTVNIGNSIVALNTDTGAPNNPDAFGAFTSTGYNLIGNGTGGTGFTGTADQVGTAGTPINPLINSLAFYGGVTQTRALLANSPAIDKGNTLL